MHSSSSVSALSDQLQTVIELAEVVERHPDAQAAFQVLLQQVQAECPDTAMLLEQLWQAYISTRRSAVFWKQMSQVEKRLSDRIAESHVQLKQNYLRLVQEQ